MLLMKDIIDDSNELIRTVSKEVELPLSKENHDLLMKMHEFLVASQDEELSEKYDLRRSRYCSYSTWYSKKNVCHPCFRL